MCDLGIFIHQLHQARAMVVCILVLRATLEGEGEKRSEGERHPRWRHSLETKKEKERQAGRKKLEKRRIVD